MRRSTAFLKYLTIAACGLGVAFPASVFAGQGPGFSLSPSHEQSGPGYEAPSFSEEQSNYYFQALDNPVVKETHKYAYDQMSQDLNELKQRYGSHMQLISIGKTHDGREVYDVIVGNQNSGRHVLIQAGIHAREYITTPLVMKQLEYTLAYYENGTYNGRALSSMFDQIAVHFVPMANPDGISLSQMGESGIGSEELRQGIRSIYQADLSLARTNLPYEEYLKVWKSNAKGVDLNYNFDAQWSTTERKATQPSYTGYKGTGPLAEPEAAALASVIGNYPIKAVINYHAMGQVIYWDTPGNKQSGTSLRLAQMFAQPTGYQVQADEGLLGLKDWVQTKQQPIPSITVEVGKSPCPVPFSEFSDIWNQNRSGVARVMEFLR